MDNRGNSLIKRRIDVKLRGSESTSSEFSKRISSSEEVHIDDIHFHPILSCESICIRPGVQLMTANHPMIKPVHIDYEIEHAPISFSYTLSEKIRCTIRNGLLPPTVMERSPGDSVMAYLPQTTGTIDIFPDQRIAGISIHFSESAFKELFPLLPDSLGHLDAALGGQSAIRPIYMQSRFGADTFHILNQILQCPYSGDIRRIFFEAKILELVVLKMNELGQKKEKPALEPDRRDINRIQEAYHILLTRLDHPPSLVDLGRIVGINRNKLNHGFKILFGDTAFNLLRYARLSKARSLIEDSNLSLSEIALAVGYNSQANFTTAFRNYYGKTPKTVRQEE